MYMSIKNLVHINNKTFREPRESLHRTINFLRWFDVVNSDRALVWV
jgi:hypothetical protein